MISSTDITHFNTFRTAIDHFARNLLWNDPIDQFGGEASNPDRSVEKPPAPLITTEVILSLYTVRFKVGAF